MYVVVVHFGIAWNQGCQMVCIQAPPPRPPYPVSLHFGSRLIGKFWYCIVLYWYCIMNNLATLLGTRGQLVNGIICYYYVCNYVPMYVCMYIWGHSAVFCFSQKQCPRRAPNGDHWNYEHCSGAGLPDGLHIFIPKIPIWLILMGPSNRKRWYVLWPFGIF
jgi:hypothetical protein